MCNADAATWISAPMQCVICTREWIATFCRCPSTLECPSCGYMNPAPEHPAARSRCDGDVG